MNNQCTNHTNLWIAIPKCVSSDKSFVLGNKGVKTTLDPVFRSVIPSSLRGDVEKKSDSKSPFENARTTQNHEFEDQNKKVEKNGLF